eukprot:TRINITY_DN1249_c0_g2_i4.p4 TRINITY_DN1249_c0_g2~~TRINITY_DN1249_c0_g2_i4.p4  ORF type:complete len:118 (-),score=13.65 TRINITY_DN1249_c0_g2_i4:2528-2881(-)
MERKVSINSRETKTCQSRIENYRRNRHHRPHRNMESEEETKRFIHQINPLWKLVATENTSPSKGVLIAWSLKHFKPITTCKAKQPTWVSIDTVNVKVENAAWKYEGVLKSPSMICVL